VLSEDAGTRRVVFRGEGVSGTPAITVGVTNIPYLSIEDSTASWNGSQFTVPETGDYDVDVSALFTSNNVRYLALYVDGVIYKSINDPTSSVNYAKGSVLGTFIKGQVLSVRSQSAAGNVTGATAGFHYLSIAKRSSPQTIAATETVAARGRSASATSLGGSGTTTVIPLTSKDFDTHNALDLTSGFTVPVTGYYTISAGIRTAGTTATFGNFLIIFSVDSTAQSRASFPKISGTSATAGGIHSDTLYLTKGQVLSLRVFHDSGVALALSAVPQDNFFSITRVGN
jgi:hypothetical protein